MPADLTAACGLSAEAFAAAFPFHLVLDERLCVVQAGPMLRRLCPELAAGTPLIDAFRITRPPPPHTFAALAAATRAVYVLECRSRPLPLRGQMLALAEDRIAFLGSPWITELDGVAGPGLSLADFAVHDPVADFLLLMQSTNRALRETRDLAERLAQQRATLRKREAALSTVIAASPDIIVVVTGEGVVRSISPAVREILGYPAEVVAGRNVLAAVHPDDAEAMREALHRAAAGAQEVVLQHRLRQLDGRWRVLEARARPLRSDARAEDAEVLLVSRDMTERVQMEEEVARARDQAQEASRAKSEFLSRMSHELRTPLNAILGFAQLLAMQPSSDGQRDQLELILSAGRHLLTLIDEVLDISRIEAGRLSVSIEPASLAAAIEDALPLVWPLAEQHTVTLSVTPPPDSLCVLADQQRLKQILHNLLTNAIKYNREHGQVEVACEPRDGVVRLTVRDTGPGLTTEQLGRLFRPFERLDADHRGIGGTGIGLALSRYLAELMDGGLEAASEPGAGSVFTLTLPAAQSSAVTAPEPAAPLSEPAPSAPSAAVTVLCVDDNALNRKLIRQILQRRPGVQLLTAASGSEALELLHTQQPALVLLDLQLPDIHGGEVLRRLRATPAMAALPVAIISADATHGRIDELLAAGAQDYLTKPIDVAALLTLVDRYVAAAA